MLEVLLEAETERSRLIMVIEKVDAFQSFIPDHLQDQLTAANATYWEIFYRYKDLVAVNRRMKGLAEDDLRD